MKTTRKDSPIRDLVMSLLTGWLWAIPFALFFALIMGGESKGQLGGVYLVSVVFAYCNIFANWFARNVIKPALHRKNPATLTSPSRIMADVLAYIGCAIAGSMIAAVLIHTFIFHGFLGSLRAIGSVAAFTRLFAALFVGMSYAYHFYKDSLARARA